MEIINDFRNELLKRREMEIKINQEGNPGFSGAMDKIVEHLKTDKERIVVRAVRSKFGENDFLIEAFVYDSVEDKVKTEPRKKEKKAAAGGGK